LFTSDSKRLTLNDMGPTDAYLKALATELDALRCELDEVDPTHYTRHSSLVKALKEKSEEFDRVERLSLLVRPIRPNESAS
jgi:hypothetical protein